MDKVADIKVMETTNYGQFKKLLGNRELTPGRVSAIKESILRIGYQPSPAIVNEKMEVIDGQGRIAACEDLGIPALYIVKPGLTVDDCISMNLQMKNWGDLDYIRSYADRGYPAYVVLVKMIETYPLLDWTKLVLIEGGSKNPSSANAMKHGRLSFRPFTYEEHERARWVSAIIPYIKASAFKNSSTAEMLIRLDIYNLVNKKRMLESFEKYANKVSPITGNAEGTLEALNRLYNHNRRINEYFADSYRAKADRNSHKKATEKEVC